MSTFCCIVLKVVAGGVVTCPDVPVGYGVQRIDDVFAQFSVLALPPWRSPL